MYNGETWEKALFERPEQRTTALDAAWLSAPARLAYLVRNTICLISNAPIEHADDHLGELRDATGPGNPEPPTRTTAAGCG
jgi:hypothetical protein